MGQEPGDTGNEPAQAYFLSVDKYEVGSFTRFVHRIFAPFIDNRLNKERKEKKRDKERGKWLL